MSVDADLEPRIHYLLHQPSTTWQYIVADPETSHCIVIDPVMDGESTSKGGLSTVTVDGILDEIRRNQYKVDHVLETKCHPGDNRYASWYLRMQLLESQGYAPQVSSGEAAVQRMGGLFARKYGRSIQSSLNEREQVTDGQPFFVGNMTVVMKLLPGLCAPEGRMFIVGDRYVFGAHEIVLLRSKMREDDFDQKYPLQTMTEDECHQLWISVQKVLSMPSDMQIYFCRGTAAANEQLRLERSSKGKNVRFGGLDKRVSERRSNASGAVDDPGPLKTFTAAAEAKTANKDVADISNEFMERWSARRSIVAEKGGKR